MCRLTETKLKAVLPNFSLRSLKCFSIFQLIVLIQAYCSHQCCFKHLIKILKSYHKPTFLNLHSTKGQLDNVSN